ncbi:hypothetical protein HYV80_04625 [Candidatus Woesearchaeota archaeon]|nr:hypothetical protein [Candidatus Woesearchaeota archaeon]
MNEKKEFGIEVFKTVAPIIDILFGGIVGATTGSFALLVQGFEYLSKRNKEWWEEFINEVDVLFMIDDARKSAENIQFIRELVQKVAFENREEKRKRYLNLAINSYKKKISFDEKLSFLNILDRLSEEELVYLLSIYEEDHTIINESFLNPREKSLINVLSGHGLVQRDIDSIGRAFEKVGESFEQLKREANTGSMPYDHFFHKPNLEFRQNEFGYKFVNFIKRETK